MQIARRREAFNSVQGTTFYWRAGSKACHSNPRPRGAFRARDDGKSVLTSSTPAPPQGTQSTSLRKYLRGILEGQDEATSLKSCAGRGPRETWEDLKTQATRLPRDYPQRARRAIVFLVTEDCPIDEWPSESVKDPVLSLQLLTWGKGLRHRRLLRFCPLRPERHLGTKGHQCPVLQVCIDQRERSRSLKEWDLEATLSCRAPTPPSRQHLVQDTWGHIH